MSRLSTPRSGFVLNGTRLEVFSPRRRAVFRLWPRTVAAARETNGRWKRLSAEIDLATPYLGTGFEDLDSVLGGMRRIEGVLRYLISRIPAAVRTTLALFPWRAFRPLQFMSRAPELPRLLELFGTNPALAFALAHHGEHGLSATAAHALAAAPQRQALAALKFPDSASAARILRKLTPGACTLPHLLRVREALLDPERARRLAHVKRVTADVVRVLGDALLAAHASDALLAQLAEADPADSIGNTAAMLRDAVTMRNAVDRAERGRDARVVYESRAHLLRDHDALMEVATRPPAPVTVVAERRQPAPAVVLGPWRPAPVRGAVRPRGERRPPTPAPQHTLRYPDPPPLPKTRGIEPVRSQQEAIEEGQIMSHCVGNLAYDPEIFAGRAYLYRVIWPLSRATLAIGRRVHHSAWTIDQLSGEGNAAVPARTRSAIQRWIRGYPAAPAVRRTPVLPGPAPFPQPLAPQRAVPPPPACQLHFAFAVEGDAGPEV